MTVLGTTQRGNTHTMKFTNAERWHQIAHQVDHWVDKVE